MIVNQSSRVNGSNLGSALGRRYAEMMPQRSPAASEPTRTATVANIRRAFAIAAALAAAVVFVARVPPTLRDLDRRASFNAHETPIGRIIQGADGLDIDNDFLVQALTRLPPRATYTLQLSQSPQVARGYGIVPTTFHALPGYVEYLLLPRRSMDPRRAQYLLCYACDTTPFDPHLHRLWTDPHGYVIGRLER
jgi:hypothetical protein